MRKMKVKRTIYSVLWMIVFMFSIDWGTATLRYFLNEPNVNIFALLVVIFASEFISVQKFIDNIFRVMVYRAIEKREG